VYHPQATYSVDVLPELFPPLRLVDDPSPLALKRAHKRIHVFLELSADAKLIVDEDLAQLIDAAFELLNPWSGSL
jgi:hypothetical protein